MLCFRLRPDIFSAQDLVFMRAIGSGTIGNWDWKLGLEIGSNAIESNNRRILPIREGCQIASRKLTLSSKIAQCATSEF